MSLQGIFQQGYVTRDLDRAMALYGPIAGVADFTVFDLELPLRTPQGDRAMQLRVATGWAGTMQIELIQPVSGYIDPYVGGLPTDPADFTPRFHHVAVRRDDPEQMAREVAALGLPLWFETGGAGISSMFVDAAASIGHPIEFVCATPEGWQMLGWPQTV